MKVALRVALDSGTDAEMMLKSLGHQCSDEPLNDLEALLLELKSARATSAATN